MVVISLAHQERCPRPANSTTDNLVVRAVDVVLKEAARPALVLLLVLRAKRRCTWSHLRADDAR